MERICFIVPNLKIGGGNRVFIELANELVYRNYEVEIIHPVNTQDKITFDISPKIKITSIGRFRDSKLSKSLNLIKLFFFVYKEKRQDKLIISDPLVSILFIFFPKRNLYRYIQSDDFTIFDENRAIIPNRLMLSIYKKFILISYQKNIKFIFNSRFVYECFLSQSKRNDVPCHVVHPAIDSSKFIDLQQRNWTEKISIGLVGRRQPIKGFSDFIIAWRNLDADVKKMIDKVYVISHDDLSDFDIDHFTILNPRSDSDISQYLNQIHIFVFPSWREGFGLPPLEAMACGCSCIISACGGSSEYASDNENCLLFEPRDTARLKNLLSESIKNTVFLKEVASKGKETVKLFSWQRSATSLLKILEIQ